MHSLSTTSGEFLDFRSSGRITAYPEVIPKKCGFVRFGNDPPGTRIAPAMRLNERVALKSTIHVPENARCRYR